VADPLFVVDKMTPYRCHKCRRRTSDLMFCPVCKRTVCMACVVNKIGEVKYASGKYVCDKCKTRRPA